MDTNVLQYVESGSGPLVLLVHGMAGTGATHFQPLIADLAAAGFRAVAPDLRGHGLSQAFTPHAGLGLFTHHAYDLLALLDRLGAAQAHLIGYSDGGEIAIALAGIAPERVASLCVWGASGRVPPPQIVALYADPAQRIPNWSEFHVELTALHGPDGPKLLQLWAATMVEYAAQGGALNDAEAAKIQCPTLILAGSNDPFNPLPAVQALAKRISGARLMVLPAGHDLLAERGTEIATIVRRFLAAEQHQAQ